jgi:hypothetical protein
MVAGKGIIHGEKKSSVVWHQGDQIGHIFAHWVIANFGHFFENYISSLYFLS